MKNFVMAMLVVGLMAVGAQAGITLTITDNGSPAAGLSSFTITANATGSDTKVVIITDLVISGDVHNVWPNVIDGATTEEFDDLSGAFWDSAWDKYDTHTLIPAADINTFLGGTWSEGNDDSDPAGLALIGPTGLEAFTPEEGEGSFGMVGAGATVALLPGAMAASYDFLQVVYVTANGAPTLSVEIGGDVSFTSTTFEDVEIIPEPTTLLILAGGVLLSAIRRR